ncbi:hypothetical protein [Streptomonospora salina]|uniref:Uncharacterized protein n=1 Tax=Streptomonospora salina TaxID=104205 RepID=A0A841E571_9ACTN|nr:hypothetical protein [Streptomonospora salina]MBB5998156.1 hypothetical protein [Streptomonospora salina]
MDVTTWLLRRARPRPFVVTALGGTGLRIAVEDELRRRSWQPALTPVAADMLVVCGPSDGELAQVLDRVWEQIPEPRVRVLLDARDDVARSLNEGSAALAESAEIPRREPPLADSAHPAPDPSGHGGAGSGRHEDSGAADASAHSEEHGAHDRSEGAGSAAADEHGGHSGHDMHGGGAEMPGGLPMAERAADRDGLTLDRLHAELGPALPDWPAGLRVSLTLQGDVVHDAAASVVGAPPADTARFWTAPHLGGRERGGLSAEAAAALDGMQRLLAVAGWSDAAATGRRLRDDLLRRGPRETWRAQCRRWTRTVRRSRLLRWSTDGLGSVAPDAPEALRGDVTARWKRRLDTIEAAAAQKGAAPTPTDAGTAAQCALDLLPSLLAGQELAAVRLIVASLDPDLEAPVADGAEAHHG